MIKIYWHKTQAWARSFPLQPLLFKIALGAWILDVLSCLYMVKWWTAKDLSTKLLLTSLAVNGIPAHEVAPEFKDEFFGLVSMLFSGMLLALIITNTIFYIGYAKQKKWAVPYVTGYILTAGVIGLTFWADGFPVGGAWELINILGAPIYLLMGFMVWTRKKEINPAFGSPAQ